MAGEKWGISQVQYLVRAAEKGQRLPDLASIERHFADIYPIAAVNNRADGYLLTFPGNVPGSKLENLLPSPAEMTYHTVKGCVLQLDLVIPDVYGCDVTFDQDTVDVHVGAYVIDKLITKGQPQHAFTCGPPIENGELIEVKYTKNGHIVVECRSFSKHSPLLELSIVSFLMKLLSPFEIVFLGDPLPVGDRCFTKVSNSRSVIHAGPIRYAVAIIRFDKIGFEVCTSEQFIVMISRAYPTLRPSFDADQMIVVLLGQTNLMERASEHIIDYMKKLPVEKIQFRGVEATMIKNPKVHRYLWQLFKSKDASVYWKFDSFKSQSSTGSPYGDMATVHLVSPPWSTNEIFMKTYYACFKTAHISIDGNLHGYLLSISWRKFLADLQKPREDGITPVVKVEGSTRISICDTQKNIEITCHAVSDFLHGCVLDIHPDFYEQMETKSFKVPKGWQLNFLKRHCPESLKHTTSVERDSVCIHAPRRTMDKCEAKFWQYMAQLWHQEIPMSASSFHALQTADDRRRVQALLDQEGLVCHWTVQRNRLTFTAQHTDCQRLENIFTSEIRTQLSPTEKEGSEQQTDVADQQRNQEQHTEITVKEAEDILIQATQGVSEEETRSEYTSRSSPVPERGRVNNGTLFPAPQAEQSPGIRGFKQSRPESARFSPYSTAGTNDRRSSGRRSDPGPSTQNTMERDDRERTRQSDDCARALHDEVAKLAAQVEQEQSTHQTQTANSDTISSSINSLLQIQLQASNHARLSMLENNYLLLSKERGPGPESTAVPLESRFVNMQHQLDEIKQLVRASNHHSTNRSNGSNMADVCNPSDSESVPSGSASIVSQRVQRQQRR